MKTFLVFCAFLLIRTVLLAQPTPTFIPLNIGGQVNSTYDEISPVVSPDGKTLYFTRVNHPENTYGQTDSQDIWYSTFENSSWLPAKRLTELNIGRYNSVLGISKDGNTLLINGVYTKRGAFWKKRGLSTSYKQVDGWSVPEKLKIRKYAKRNKGTHSSATISSDEQTLILSFSKKYNGERTDLYVSTTKRNNKWKRAKKLKGLNSRRSEIAPFLSTDTKTLYFASDRKKRGQFDIYKSQKTGTSIKRWSKPVALSDTINSSAWESYFKTNLKSSAAYYASANEKSVGNADIFFVKLFEENPFVIVSGKILHQRTQRPMVGKQIDIKIDGIKVDSVVVDKKTATFSVWLPLGKAYQLSAAAQNYSSINTSVDASSIREFTKVDQNLMIDPNPFVRVKTRMLIEGTNELIPSSASPKLFVDYKIPDSLVVDQTDGTYSFLLLHGAQYQVQAKANKFESSTSTLDLTAVDEFIDTVFNVYASLEKMAFIYGNIINKKTNSPFPPGTKLTINVIGESTVYASVDTSKSTYELRLPFGKKYEINANAPNFYPVYEVIDATTNTASDVNKDLVIAPIEVGQSIRLNNIFFTSGKAVLKPESYAELDRVSEFLLSNEIKIEIGGHTDNVGKSASNIKLSENRAKAVIKYVISKGVASSRLVAKGYGSTKPVADNKTTEGKAQNRRVEFTILKE